ncbi:MAG TPA: CDP-alcohol phosphatidyltransferase family protein [Tepidisphaeraceae bacterium]|nr:CDP-alcohol phosphatidyltransferase family protein [Tepidisphaeraceae bacterium]
MPRKPLHIRHTSEPFGWPLGITMLRLLLLPVFLYLLLIDSHGAVPHPHRWWAVAVFVVMAATDKLDGYLARKLNQTTRLGALLDPVADKLLILSSIVILSFEWIAEPGYAIPIWVVAVVYAKDVFVAIGTLVLLSLMGRVTIHARWLGKISTVAQLVLILATILSPDLQDLAHGNLHAALWWIDWLVVGISAIACADYLIAGIITYRTQAGSS